MSDGKPLVAICIPTYNQAEFLGKAIRSAIAQDYRPIEIWISDDASTDETAAVVKDFLGGETPVYYFRQPANSGLAKNNNWVMRQPDADFILQLDSDDALEPDCVARMMELLLAYPRAGFAHGAVREIDTAGNFRRVRRLFRSTVYQPADSALRESRRGYRVAANNCMYRAKALREVGFCRPMNFAQDWDLAVRLADAGWGNVYSPATLGSYRVWDDESNSRAKRKKTELLGIESVFRDSLVGAYQRRGWPTAPLQSAMKSFALAHCECLGWSCFTAQEKRELESILVRMGRSKLVAAKCWLAQHGFCAFFRLQRSLAVFVKDAIKSLLRGANKPNDLLPVRHLDRAA